MRFPAQEEPSPSRRASRRASPDDGERGSAPDRARPRGTSRLCGVRGPRRCHRARCHFPDGFDSFHGPHQSTDRVYRGHDRGRRGPDRHRVEPGIALGGRRGHRRGARVRLEDRPARSTPSCRRPGGGSRRSRGMPTVVSTGSSRTVSWCSKPASRSRSEARRCHAAIRSSGRTRSMCWSWRERPTGAGSSTDVT